MSVQAIRLNTRAFSSIVKVGGYDLSNQEAIRPAWRLSAKELRLSKGVRPGRQLGLRDSGRTPDRRKKNPYSGKNGVGMFLEHQDCCSKVK